MWWSGFSFLILLGWWVLPLEPWPAHSFFSWMQNNFRQFSLQMVLSAEISLTLAQRVYIVPQIVNSHGTVRPVPKSPFPAVVEVILASKFWRYFGESIPSIVQRFLCQKQNDSYTKKFTWCPFFLSPNQKLFYLSSQACLLIPVWYVSSLVLWILWMRADGKTSNRHRT